MHKRTNLSELEERYLLTIPSRGEGSKRQQLGRNVLEAERECGRVRELRTLLQRTDLPEAEGAGLEAAQVAIWEILLLKE